MGFPLQSLSLLTATVDVPPLSHLEGVALQPSDRKRRYVVVCRPTAGPVVQNLRVVFGGPVLLLDSLLVLTLVLSEDNDVLVLFDVVVTFLAVLPLGVFRER